MQQATLGTIPGAGAVKSRRRSEASREYRGTFAFARQHEASLVQLLASRDTVEYVGPIDGQRLRLEVMVTDVSIENGIAYFQGVGEPYATGSGTQAG